MMCPTSVCLQWTATNPLLASGCGVLLVPHYNVKLAIVTSSRCYRLTPIGRFLYLEFEALYLVQYNHDDFITAVKPSYILCVTQFYHQMSSQASQLHGLESQHSLYPAEVFFGGVFESNQHGIWARWLWCWFPWYHPGLKTTLQPNLNDPHILDIFKDGSQHREQSFIIT